MTFSFFFFFCKKSTSQKHICKTNYYCLLFSAGIFGAASAMEDAYLICLAADRDRYSYDSKSRKFKQKVSVPKILKLKSNLNIQQSETDSSYLL